VAKYDEWNEQYLLNLPEGEQDWFEVKGRRSVDLTCPGVDENDARSLLSKALSAFANSGGGTIVLGLRNVDGKWKVDDGGIRRSVKSPSTKEWLEDIVPYLVDPRLLSFDICAVVRSDPTSTIADGSAVYMVHVGDSEAAPHQALDSRYYGRVGGKSRPLSHQFVMDIIGRRRHPKMTMEFEIATWMEAEGALYTLATSLGRTETQTKKNRKTQLICHVLNEGRSLANYVSCMIKIPLDMLERNEALSERRSAFRVGEIEYVEWNRKNVRRDVMKYSMMGLSEYGPSWFDPILPRLSYSWEWDIKADFDPKNCANEKIYWTVYADNAAPSEGEIALPDIQFVDRSAATEPA
jgi:hypothetical protein